MKTAVATNLAPAAIVDDVHKEVQELLALAEKQPAALSARERRSLVDLLVRIQVASDPSPQKAAAQLYQSYERLFADENDDARAQLVLLKLVRGNACVPPDFSEAEQVAARITSPRWPNGRVATATSSRPTRCSVPIGTRSSRISAIRR